MHTVIETPVYSAKAATLLTDAERESIAAFVASNPRAGAVLRGSGGIRKIRWSRGSRGKSGGVRVIYFNRLSDGEIWFLTLYAKSERATISAYGLRLIKEALVNGEDQQNE